MNSEIIFDTEESRSYFTHWFGICNLCQLSTQYLTFIGHLVKAFSIGFRGQDNKDWRAFLQGVLGTCCSVRTKHMKILNHGIQSQLYLGMWSLVAPFGPLLRDFIRDPPLPHSTI